MSKVYFIYSDVAVRFDTGTGKIDRTARPLRKIWPSLPPEWSSCDAVLNYGRGLIYFFKGQKFVRYNILSNSVDWGEDDNGQPGYHIAKYLQGFPAHWPKVDAAVNYGNGRIYLFYQDEYARYDIYENRIDQEIKKTHANWIGIPEEWLKFDGALNYGDGKIYFFLNGMQVRFDIDTERVDQPIKSIADAWSDVSPGAIPVTAPLEPDPISVTDRRTIPQR